MWNQFTLHKAPRSGPFRVRYTLVLPQPRGGALYFRRKRLYRVAYQAIYGELPR